MGYGRMLLQDSPPRFWKSNMPSALVLLSCHSFTVPEGTSRISIAVGGRQSPQIDSQYCSLVLKALAFIQVIIRIFSFREVGKIKVIPIMIPIEES